VTRAGRGARYRKWCPRLGVGAGILSLLSVAALVRADPSLPPRVNIVPRPVAVEFSTGTFLLSPQTRILGVDRESRRIAALFNDYLYAQHGPQLRVSAKPPRHVNFILFGLMGSGKQPAEGYHLTIGPSSIRVSGHGAGLYYGMQTLTQLLPSHQQSSIELPNLDITDYPRFGYRGLLLDVGRHYFPVSYLKRLLDLAAQYKINRFHWHLTDNEGWRIQINKYPRLTDVRSSEYYTQQQVRDIVAYAQARFITVIPEIEMPGHSGAAVAAYPFLACAHGDVNVLCPTEETFRFLRNVLREVAALFPGPYIHIGGDEVDKKGWRMSPEAQIIMKQKGLQDEDQLQSYFVKRVGKFLTSRSKRMIGWDEIMEGGLAADAVVMSWRGESGGIEAARQGHWVIMAPTDYTYFDYNQGDPSREPANIGGFLPLAKAYGYDPIPKEMPTDGRQYVLGAQANVWTEYIGTPDYLEYMLFPRLLAFSEAVWSPAAGRDYEGFRRRLPYQLDRLDREGVRYRIPEPDGLKDFYTTTDDHAIVELNSVVPASLIHYTLDGSEPNETSPSYQGPLQIALQANQKVDLKLIVVAPGDRHSVVYGATFQRRPYREAIGDAPRQPGLAYSLVDGNFSSARGVGQRTPAVRGVTDSLDLQQFERSSDYGISFDGFLNVPADSYYRFAVESDDGSVLQIDDEVVVDNDGNHPSRIVTGHIPLRHGLHRFKLEYFQAEGGATLRVSWAASESELQLLTGAFLSH
jgi:hexosaminidase